MTTIHYRLCLLTGLLCWVGQPLYAQTDTTTRRPPKKARKESSVLAKPLFTTDDVLSLTLAARMAPILRDRVAAKEGKAETAYSALMTTPLDTGGTGQVPVRLQVRGNFRRMSANCSFPPLYLLLPKKEVKGTPFARQSTLKLVTHCDEERFVVREYLVYKQFNLLTDLSYRARLAQVTYVDSARKLSGLTRWGIFLEDVSDVAKRNQATPFKNRYRAEHCDTLTMATVAIFDYMIGNTDWSVNYRHNIRLVTDSTHKRPRPIPYDFDHSGIVNAPYAKPAEVLEISSVRNRIYRGPIYPLSVLTKVLDRFKAVKPAIYALYQTDTRLEKSYIRQTITYLDDFYALIDDPKAISRIFQDPAGRGVSIKGLDR